MAATSWPMNPAPAISEPRARAAAARASAAASRGACAACDVASLGARERAGARRWRSARGRRAARRRSPWAPCGRGIERDGRVAEPQLDAVLGVPGGGPQRERVVVHRARQALLGERRAVVGQPPLVADERDRAVVAAPAQRLGAALRGEAGADEDDAS